MSILGEGLQQLRKPKPQEVRWFEGMRLVRAAAEFKPRAVHSFQFADQGSSVSHQGGMQVAGVGLFCRNSAW